MLLSEIPYHAAVMCGAIAAWASRQRSFAIADDSTIVASVWSVVLWSAFVAVAPLTAHMWYHYAARWHCTEGLAAAGLQLRLGHRLLSFRKGLMTFLPLSSTAMLRRSLVAKEGIVYAVAKLSVRRRQGPAHSAGADLELDEHLLPRIVPPPADVLEARPDAPLHRRITTTLASLACGGINISGADGAADGSGAGAYGQLTLDLYFHRRRYGRVLQPPTEDGASSAAASPGAAAAVPAPIVLWLHGGAWRTGSSQFSSLPIIYELARQGWLVVSVNYRLAPAAQFPAMLCDAKAAIAWVRLHAAELKADPEFILIAGDSAGGHLALMTGLTPNVPRYQPHIKHLRRSASSVRHSEALAAAVQDAAAGVAAEKTVASAAAAAAPVAEAFALPSSGILSARSDKLPVQPRRRASSAAASAPAVATANASATAAATAAETLAAGDASPAVDIVQAATPAQALSARVGRQGANSAAAAAAATAASSAASVAADAAVASAGSVGGRSAARARPQRTGSPNNSSSSSSSRRGSSAAGKRAVAAATGSGASGSGSSSNSNSNSSDSNRAAAAAAAASSDDGCTGGSAGAHGSHAHAAGPFGGIDTAVQGIIDLYGVADFTDGSGVHWRRGGKQGSLRDFVGPVVLQATYDPEISVPLNVDGTRLDLAAYKRRAAAAAAAAASGGSGSSASASSGASSPSSASVSSASPTTGAGATVAATAASAAVSTAASASVAAPGPAPGSAAGSSAVSPYSSFAMQHDPSMPWHAHVHEFILASPRWWVHGAQLPVSLANVKMITPLHIRLSSECGANSSSSTTSAIARGGAGQTSSGSGSSSSGSSSALSITSKGGAKPSPSLSPEEEAALLTTRCEESNLRPAPAHAVLAQIPDMCVDRKVPPICIVHGAGDNLVTVGDSDVLAAELQARRARDAAATAAALARGEVPSPVNEPPLVPDCYMRLPAAHHAFNNLVSGRSFAMSDAIADWANALWERYYLRKRQQQLMASGSGSGSGSSGAVLAAAVDTGAGASARPVPQKTSRG